MINLTLERSATNINWGFVLIGGKDQNLTVKVGKVRPFSPAETAGLKTFDYIWTINGKEVFEMDHGACVEEIKKSGTTLSLATERGDHIVPNFEEIWPSKKGGKGPRRGDGNLDYYLDAMENGPKLSGHLPIPANFTTVGKPQIFVNQYDSPLDVYSEDTIDEMKEDRLVNMNPDYQERLNEKKAVQKSDNPFAKMNARKFDVSKSNVLDLIQN